jgi:hypothetical protein
MKVAFCLFGLSGLDNLTEVSKESKEMNGCSYEIMKKSYEQYKKYIFDVNKNINIDIYFHTRNHSNIEKIKELYKPKDYLIDDVKNISYMDGLTSVPHNYNKAIMSRHDSVKKVLNLVKEQYDLIFLCRFDLYFLKPVNFTEIIINKNQIMFAQNNQWKVNNECFKGFGDKNHSLEIKNGNYKVIKMNKYHVVDHWLLFKPENIDKIIEMGDAHSNSLKNINYYANGMNIHYFIAKYLIDVCKLEIVHWENHYYTCFTRYFV